ncbi:DUF3365 domain-containing protein [Spirulina sp. CS-785/01]|uniref:Tll0287-like domain-containing protein n=1 Tax=Spirulina sp. CS-785/01 TaxID=3021716 RepID=UPI00232ECDFA|nr:DUF3365 domain-containing protein [Spirulina sp. CS-785/01]MDB9311807.1 DUF3365 domain-containing protein [Spirulina sp. CS-785/01]
MYKNWPQVMLGILGAIALFLWHPSPAQAEITPSELGKAVQEIENLDQMRSGLASTIEDMEGQPTMETMKQVCKPVGMQAKQLSKENNWELRQVSAKYRNPAHAPKNDAEEQAVTRFQENPELMAFWEKDTLDGQEGVHYFRRITVEASCLACHGPKGERPDFVKENYPNDLAYNFNVGDLRGMYSVFIPEVKAALQAALVQN